MAFARTTLDDKMHPPPNCRPRLILLTQFYDPEPAYKGQAFAEAIAALGYDVEVVTGFPNYPGGRVYPGYRIRPWQRECRGGIRITRLALFPSHGTSRLGRALNYLSFFASALLYLCLGARRAHLIYVYSPPLTAGLAAALAGMVRRCPVVVDIHDLWPDTLPATGMITNARLLRWIGHAAEWLYRRVQFIILHTQGFRDALLARGVPAGKMQSVIGWTNEYPVPAARPDTARQLAEFPGLTLLYAGNIGPAQALDAVIDAAHLLQARGETTIARFYFLGGGVSQSGLEQRARALGLDNVEFLPRVPPHEVGAWLDAADALLVHLRADPLFEITLPSKTQAYLYAGKPILMAVAGEAGRLVAAAGAGICARPQDPQGLADAVIALARMTEDERADMGARGRAHYLRELSMRQGMAKFALIFERVRRR